MKNVQYKAKIEKDVMAIEEMKQKINWKEYNKT
jgi:hypothetical protein